jgi:iron complex outermembrane receptor protein
MTDQVTKLSLTRKLSLVAAIAAILAVAAVQAAEPENKTELEEIEEIRVFGQGQSRQVAEVGAIEITKEAPGTSALKVISKLPGVSFQSADPYGAYEWSTRISVRGFNQNQLGFTLDGVPLGDMTYGNHNGLHISRAISSENIGSAVLSQGAGSLDTASSSNLGGTLEFFSIDPATEFGANVALTGGSDSDLRGFARFETGELGAAGTRAYLSYTNQQADKWKGDGEQKQEQFNFKIVQPIGEGKLSAFYNYSDRQENDYQDLSLDMIERLGYDWDNLSAPSEWPVMVEVAQIYQGTLPGPYPSPITTVDDAYANASGLRQDDLAAITLNLPFGNGWSWDTTVYLHQNEGQGIWFTPYVVTPVGAPDGRGGTIGAGANAPISVRTTEYNIDRWGATTALTAEFGNHTVSSGLWYEDNDFEHARRFYGLELAAPQRDSLEFMRDPFFTQWHVDFNTETMQFFLQDEWQISDALKINFGFKSLDVENEAQAILLPATRAEGTIEAKDSFLPQVGFNWRLSDASEVFGSYTENMRAFQAASTVGPFATTPANFALLEASGGLEPETSTTYELGWRYNVASVQAVAAIYYVDFKDRLLTNTVGAGIVGNPTVLQNVGDVETTGAELGVLWLFAQDWSWYNSASYNTSEYQDDVVANVIDPITGQPVQVVTPTGGKNVVDTPQELFNSEIGYDNGTFWGKLGLSYVGKRYFTYTNTGGKVDSYAVFNLGLGYRLENLDFGKNLSIQANVTNLFDESYVSTLGSNGFVNAGDAQTVLAGAPLQWFLSLSGQF